MPVKSAYILDNAIEIRATGDELSDQGEQLDTTPAPDYLLAYNVAQNLIELFLASVYGIFIIRYCAQIGKLFTFGLAFDFGEQLDTTPAPDYLFAHNVHTGHTAIFMNCDSVNNLGGNRSDFIHHF
jgi:hypothetical protein